MFCPISRWARSSVPVVRGHWDDRNMDLRPRSVTGDQGAGAKGTRPRALARGRGALTAPRVPCRRRLSRNGAALPPLGLPGMIALVGIWTRGVRTTMLERPVSPDPTEIMAIKTALKILEEGGRRAPHVISNVTNDRVELSPSLLEVVLTAARELAAGRSITIVRSERELTTQQAADLLQVSRPHFIGLLEEGAMAFRRVGTHRRIRLSDILQYKETHDPRAPHGYRRATELPQGEPNARG